MLLGAFFVVVGYAVKGMEPDCAVCHRQSDETTFEFLELGLVYFCFLPVGFPLLLRSLSVDLLNIFMRLRLEMDALPRLIDMLLFVFIVLHFFMRLSTIEVLLAR